VKFRLFRRGNRWVTAVTGRRRRQRGWRKVRRGPLFTCGACGKGFSNPLGHVCTNKNDFRKRRRAAARSAAAEKRKARRDATRRRAAERRQRQRERTAARLSAVRRAERAKADARVAKARARRKPRRPGRPVHDYRSCRDEDCGRLTCRAFREGLEAGEDQ